MGFITRRDFLKKGATLTAGAAITSLNFPAILHAKNKYPTIKVVGTHVTLQEEIRIKAQKDLGINIEFYPGGSAEVILKAITDPSSFDVYEQWSNSIRVLHQADAIQPIDTKRLKYWDEINSLSKTGKISPNARTGAGDVPNKILYVQKDGSLGPNTTNQISFMPYVHNVDSFGYNSSVIPRGKPYETESWAWLLDKTHHGRVALVNEPTIGIFDAALAVEAKGLMKFNDMGNMSIKEINQLFKILIEYKRKGHFRGVWSSVPHSVELMANNQVDIESMFSPAVSTLNGKGIPCVYAAPKEGYRAWHGVMCLSSESRDERKDAAYSFMNWWLSGWAGAFIARQGYYISNPERSRKYMSSQEWDYWYAGKTTNENLKGTDGKISVHKGTFRNGGSYIKRFENIAVWNTVMPNYDYTVDKWNEFVMTRS